ncbi:MAG TPA: TIR domain-containing protein [Thermoanaerobaculia bacterium]|nr:TIR domain-containing protein [Thermoanaerobaculia bacterium]
MPSEFAFDVFLSHHSGDKPRVRRLAERLRAAGLRVWFDEWSIAPGEDIYLAIERGLETARTLVLFLSPAALASDWLHLERGTALFRDPVNAERRFLPVLLEDCDLPDALRRYRYIDLREDDEEAFAQLLAACTGETPPPRSAPRPAKRKRLVGLLKLGGSAVVLGLVVLGGFLLVPSQEPFPVTVFIHGEGGVQDVPLRGQGSVVLDLGSDRRREAIGDKGEAHFSGIPSSFRGQEVRVWLEAEGFEPVKSNAMQQLDEASLYLAVKRRPVALRGRVQDSEGRPVASAILRLRELTTTSDTDGAFTFEIPGNLLHEDLSLSVSAPGYGPWREAVVPGSNEVVVPLRKATS